MWRELVDRSSNGDALLEVTQICDHMTNPI